MTFREPVGVVGLITPWNFPLTIASWKVAPALAAGNTIVLKPAELTPLTAVELEKIALEAGVPEGVAQRRPGQGQRLRAAHRGASRRRQGRLHRLDGGRRGIAEGAAATIKRVTLELGGKSANVIFADSDLQRGLGAARRFGNAGQDCCARSRASSSSAPRWTSFMSALEQAVTSIKVGDPLDESTDMGPVISADQLETVSSYVNGDAPVAFRGSAPDGAGYWFPPTVLAPVSNDDRPRARRSSARWPA